MDKKVITSEMVAKLNAPLPAEAIKPHPTKNYLSTINSIYVTERLNQVFGVGSWRVRSEVISEKTSTVSTKNGQRTNIMIVTKTIFEIPEYGIYYECYGGNDNDDLGDAYKGSTTDALTKIGSYLGIGADVWKDKSKQQTAQPQNQIRQTAQSARQAAPAQQAKNVATRRERVTQFLKNLDDITFNQYCQYFSIDDVNLMTDDQVNAVANYLNAQNKK